jgi:hypothetical protein
VLLTIFFIDDLKIFVSLLPNLLNYNTMEITYDSIKTLIVEEKLEGQQVQVAFKAPGQDSPISAIAMIMPDQKEIMKNVGKSAVKQGAKSGLIGMLSRFVGGLIGGTAGSLASSATSQVAHAATTNPNAGQEVLKTTITPEKQQNAVVEAFKSVQAFYTFDEETRQWKATH